MLATITKLTVESADTMRAHWTAPAATASSWLFVDGVLQIGPYLPGAADRSVVVIVESGRTAQIEIHDMLVGEPTPASTHEMPNVLPTMRWARPDDADMYRIYHIEPGENEVLVLESAAAGFADRAELKCPVRLDGQGGAWHFLRVEAVDESRNESTRAAWAYYVMEPGAPVSLSATDGSAPGLFDITIGV